MGSWGVQAVGWLGSALLVYSLLQVNVTRLRVINLVGCLVLVVFNAVLGVWPMAVLNLVLAGINVWQLVSLYRGRSDGRVWHVLGVAGDDAYLRHILRLHAKDIQAFNPAFVHSPFDMANMHYIVLKGDEMVGIVILRDNADDERVADLLLDWVTPKYRNLAPGEFVLGRGGVVANLGYTKFRMPTAMVEPYYARLGLERDGDLWRLMA